MYKNKYKLPIGAEFLTIKEREKKTISIKDGQTNRHIYIDTITIR